MKFVSNATAGWTQILDLGHFSVSSFLRCLSLANLACVNFAFCERAEGIVFCVLLGCVATGTDVSVMGRRCASRGELPGRSRCVFAGLLGLREVFLDGWSPESVFPTKALSLNLPKATSQTQNITWHTVGCAGQSTSVLDQLGRGVCH